MCLVLFLPVEMRLKKGKELGNKRNSCLPQFGSRDFKIGHYGRLGRLDAYTGGLGP